MFENIKRQPESERSNGLKLEFDGNWRLESPALVEPEVVHEFRNLIDRTCGQGKKKATLEMYKRHFASAALREYFPSSNTGWASTDLDNLMQEASANLPLFIEAFFNASGKLRRRYPELVFPATEQINRILSDARLKFQIDSPNLIATREHVSVSLPEKTPSLDEPAQEKINEACFAADRALREGNGRQAVQELLWLMETITTAFRSPQHADKSIQGRYFNKIIHELRERGHSHQKQIFEWMAKLHGFLSSPTGGGIRHGIDLTQGSEAGINEARLYCNLIRSYVTYLLSEHERISSTAN